MVAQFDFVLNVLEGHHVQIPPVYYLCANGAPLGKEGHPFELEREAAHC